MIEIQVEESGDPVVVLSGEFDLANSGELHERAAALVASRPACIVYDLSAVEFMDSSTIAVLLWTARQVDAVRLRKPSPLVARVLDAMGLADTLEVEP